jgi:FkbH-like protein
VSAAAAAFGTLTLTSAAAAQESPPAPPAAPEGSADKVKCVAWDLDNTLWKGVIGDDGKEGVTVVAEALDLIHQLDQRGIVQTIVSKNEHDTAWEKIVELELDKYFLYPAINWNPKSSSISQIAKELNISVNSFALIDDSEFEREEVSAAYPQVRVYDPEIMSLLLDYEEFNVPVSPETGQRRLKYLEEIHRKSVYQTWDGDLDDFLRDCSIELNIRTIRNKDQFDRCLELLHRSNQFNLSGKRYTSDEFEVLLNAAECDNYALDVNDRYGNYGIVGFVSIQNTGEALIVADFVMSCRVARKKIENAFFHWYLNRKECCGKNVYARLKLTGRNQPLRQVFEELMFEVVAETDAEIMMQVDVAQFARYVPPISINSAYLGYLSVEYAGRQSH